MVRYSDNSGCVFLKIIDGREQGHINFTRSFGGSRPKFRQWHSKLEKENRKD